jgi:short-subunit dehydrogenase
VAGKAGKAIMILKHVLITGATGAIGSALALEYADSGRRLTLHGRRADKLDQLAGECRARGACVHVRALDLRDRQALRLWLAELCGDSVPDLVIANAGLNANIGTVNEGERPEEAEALVEVNLLATMALVDSVLPLMRARGSGQIAFMSSLAAYFGLPFTPTYCATKAALKVYGNALRIWLAPEGIRINVILPGYVASPMCDAMPGPKPFLWTPQRAARAIRRGLERDWARISFPFPLNVGIWGLSVLPACLAIPIARCFGYGSRFRRGRRDGHDS